MHFMQLNFKFCFALLLVVMGGGLISPGLSAHAAFPSATASGPSDPVSDEEFIGPFPSWDNAVRDYGAKGDGIHDDTLALQTAFDSVGRKGAASTLYLPAGTYRITKTLTIFQKIYFRIVGENPERVTLRWDGVPGATMFEVSNSSRLGIGRIRFDGARKAGVGLWLRWNRAAGAYFPVHTEIADCIFQDLNTGVQGGEDFHITGHQDTADGVSVKRSHFLRSTVAGVLLRDWNTLNWWISESLFEDNLVGVSNVIGGVFVYHSIFRRSVDADILGSRDLGSHMSLRDNFSSGSQRFFATSGQSADGLALTLQRNVIVGTRETPIAMGWAGSILLLDNRISFSGPALVYRALSPGNLVSVGNRFTHSPSFLVQEMELRARVLGDQVEPDIDETEPPVPAFAPTFNSPSIEVGHFDGEAIQDAIRTADRQFRGRRPVIHLPSGNYDVAETIRIARGSDVRLVGDGFLKSTVLALRRGASGPTLLFDGPSHAQLVDIDIRGAATQIAIAIRGADAAGASVFFDQLEVNNTTINDIGIDFDGLDFLALECRSLMTGSGRTNVRVSGGKQAAAGKSLGAHVEVFGGEGTSRGPDGPVWSVRQGGRLLVQDHWFEDNTARPVMLEVKDSGVVTFHGGLHENFNGKHPTSRNLFLGGISGRVSFLGIRTFGQHLETAGANPEQDFLFLGGSLSPQVDSPEFINPSTFAHLQTAGRASVLYSSTQATSGAPYTLLENIGSDDDAFLLAMLSQTREAHWHQFSAIPQQTTDIRFYRAGVDFAGTGVRIEP